jgi:hypothetical protein
MIWLKENAVVMMLAIIAATGTFTYSRSDILQLKQAVARHETLLAGYPLLVYRLGRLEDSITTNTKAVRSFMRSNSRWERLNIENNKSISANSGKWSSEKVDQKLL